MRYVKNNKKLENYVENPKQKHCANLPLNLPSL